VEDERGMTAQRSSRIRIQEITYPGKLLYRCDGLDLEVKLFCLRFSGDEEPSVLQAFEDVFWALFEPMLGKKGARSG
jgi:hypothetical protein